MNPRLIPGLNASFEEIFLIVARLPEPNFVALDAAVHGPEAFTTEKERLRRISAEVSLDPDTLGVMFRALEFIYVELSDDEAEAADVPATVDSIVSTLDGGRLDDVAKGALVSRLGSLLARNEFADVHRKAARLRTGFVPNVVSASTMVDLRPNFNQRRDTVLELIPIIQLRIRTDAADPSDRSLVVQLDSAALDKLQETLKGAQDKVRVLVDFEPLAGKVKL